MGWSEVDARPSAWAASAPLWTPPPDRRFAGIAWRGLALGLDSVLFVAYSWLVVTIAPRPLGPILGLLVAGPMVYLLLTWVILGGTPAMRLMGLRIHRAADGGPIGYRTAAIRLLVFVATVLGSVLIVGLVLFLPTVLDDTRRAIHDRVAGTVVTRRALRASRE